MKKNLLQIDDIKKLLLAELNNTYGIITGACNKVGISRQTFYNYLNSDDSFKKEVEAVQDAQTDFVESKLIENIAKNDTTSIIFYLKTKGKQRGYTDKQPTTDKQTTPIVFNTIDADDNNLDISGLTPNEKLQFLELRQKAIAINNNRVKKIEEFLEENY